MTGFYTGGAVDSASYWLVTGAVLGPRGGEIRRAGPYPMTSTSPHASRPSRLRPMVLALGGGLLTLALTLLGLLLFTFVISRVVPIDPLLSILGEKRATAAQYDAARLELGLDEPMWKQFLIYLWDAVQGDLGTSIRSRQPVLAEVAHRFPATLELATLGNGPRRDHRHPRRWRQRGRAASPIRWCGWSG
ncbi:hypothetical protein MASR1M65_03850 [Saprospiraceae bacterium]